MFRRTRLCNRQEHGVVEMAAAVVLTTFAWPGTLPTANRSTPLLTMKDAADCLSFVGAEVRPAGGLLTA